MVSCRSASHPSREPTPPPFFTEDVLDAFKKHQGEISTERREKGLTSDQVLAVAGPELQALGFEVETGKKRRDNVDRPVFFGENGVPTLRYEIDAYHSEWRCGLEV